MTTLDRYAKLLSIHRPLLPKTAKVHEGIDLLRTLILAYEAETVQIPDATGIDILHHLMEEWGLRQTDLVPGLGSKSYVSQLFTGHRSISSAVTAQLARFLHASPKHQ